MWWNKWNKKKSKPPKTPETFLGIRSGMTEQEIVTHLTQLVGGDEGASGVKVTRYSDEYGGGTVHAEGSLWTVYVTLNELEEAEGRRGRWRMSPSGLVDGVGWLRERIDEYGLPDQHAILAPDHRLHASNLEYRGSQQDEPLHPTLTFFCDRGKRDGGGGGGSTKEDEWSVREDWDRHFFERKEGGVAFAKYRRRLDALQTHLEERSVKMDHAMEQVYRSPPSSRGVEGLAEFITTAQAWLTVRMRALDALAPLVESVPIFDLFDVVARTDKLLACEVWDRDVIHDGAFVIAEWDVGANLVEPLHRLGIATGMHCKQLTYKPRRRAGEDAMVIDEHISWLPGPFAELLLRDNLRTHPCYVLPAILERVPDAKEELPPAPKEEKTTGSTGPTGPRKYSPPITPLRLSSRGASVYVNSNGTLEELRELAHALLAAKLRRSLG